MEVGIARFFAVHQPEVRSSVQCELRVLFGSKTDTPSLLRNGAQMPLNTNPNVAAKILRLVSDTLRFDKKSTATVDDISLLNFQTKEKTSAASVVSRMAASRHNRICVSS